MRKDVRLGLGIGALALLFAITFLVVRNHTENQEALAQDPDAVDVEPVKTTPPGANTPAGPQGSGPNTLPNTILPPLQPVTKPSTAFKGAQDPFIARTPRSVETPMPRPGNATAGRGGASDWDLLLATGGQNNSTPTRPAPSPRRDMGSSINLNPTPEPSLTSSPVDHVVDAPAPRSTPAPTRLSMATGRSYTIQRGDTFVSVAEAKYGNAKYYLQIEAANPNVNTMLLQPGQQIVLPELPDETRSASIRTGPYSRELDNRPVNTRTEYRVDTGDSLYRISMRVYGTPRMVEAIYDANRAAIGSNPERLRFGMILKMPQLAGGDR